MSMKNSSDTIGNQTRDLPACSAVPQPTALPHAPMHATYPSHIILLEVFILIPYLMNIKSYIVPLYCSSSSWPPITLHRIAPIAHDNLSHYMASYAEDLYINCYHTNINRKSCYHDIKSTIHGPSNYNAIHFYSAMVDLRLLPFSSNSNMINKQTHDYSVQCYLEN
jgi:hypothetical protein